MFKISVNPLTLPFTHHSVNLSCFSSSPNPIGPPSPSLLSSLRPFLRPPQSFFRTKHVSFSPPFVFPALSTTHDLSSSLTDHRTLPTTMSISSPPPSPSQPLVGQWTQPNERGKETASRGRENAEYMKHAPISGYFG